MITIRQATSADFLSIINLYKKVAETSGGIARSAHEITAPYVRHLMLKSEQLGVELVAEDLEKGTNIIAEIHCYPPDPSVFNHVLSNLTIVTHPDFQGQGIGKQIFTQLLQHISQSKPHILRLELITRESNTKAIAFYKRLGFVAEGRFEKRIYSANNTFEADIPMAWFNPNFTA